MGTISTCEKGVIPCPFFKMEQLRACRHPYCSVALPVPELAPKQPMDVSGASTISARER